MKKRSKSLNFTRCLTVGIIVMFLLMGMSVMQTTVTAEMEITNEPDYSVGDYFEYEMDEDEFVDNFGEMMGLSEDIESIENAEADTIKMEITGEETVSAGSDTYDCILQETTIGLTFDLVLKNESEASQGLAANTISFEFSMAMTKWVTKEDLNLVKDEEEFGMTVEYETDNGTTTRESKSNIVSTYSEPHSEYDLPLTVGKTWSTNTSKEVVETSENRLDGGEWDSHEDTYNETSTVNYEVVSEEEVSVPAGDFTCLKIKSQENEDSEIEYTYLSENGVPAKKVYEGEEDFKFTLELTDYESTNLGSGGEDNGLPFIGGIIAVSTLAVTALVYEKRRR